MSKAPAFQFYAADYLADEHVQVMSLEQEGAYVRLLAYCWREGSIPADLNLLSRLCKNAPVETIQPVLERFAPHPNRPERLVHPRLEAERAKQKQWSEKSAAGGRASAEKRQRKTPTRKGGSTTAARVVQPNGNTSFSSSSSFSRNSTDLDHTHKAAAERVCVSKSKFTLQQIRQYAWASHQLDQRLIGQGRKNIEGIRNPDGWAISAHRSGDYDPMIQEWIDNPGLFEIAS